MPSTRSTLARKILGASAAPALLLALAGCGDDDSGDSGDSASGSFCEEAEPLADEGLEGDGALETIQGIDPPDELAEDWNILVEVLEAVPDTDGADTDGGEQATENTAIEERIQAAVDNVTEYLDSECGIDAG
jgi:hypothetical protein